ncbi:terminase small subunit [Flagellimonas onchidii]|uniref:terminase small subunit n=1 Tax=Flagellimonas onchidii TaxID=2562684 RepID=UPI0010A6A750|nr:terminase small subunit [Allomuricauda onchidii]
MLNEPIRDPKTGQWRGSKKILTPKKLYQYFEEYKKWVKENPKIVEHYNPKLDKVVELKREIPLSIMGFRGYLSEKNIIRHVKDYIYNTKGMYEEFDDIAQKIVAECQADQFNGGATHIFEKNIITRILGLAEKQEVKTEEKVKISIK